MDHEYSPQRITNNPLGFSLIECLVALSLLCGSLLVIIAIEQFTASQSLAQEKILKELLEKHNQHEIKMALLDWQEE